MLRSEFNAIISNIEKSMEYDGYWIEVFTYSGRSFEGDWEWLNKTSLSLEVIILSGSGESPTFIPLSRIEAIQLSNR